ncbi:MAG: redox-regulated ATPase YchF [Clostridia bacterium]
MSLQCGIVGLPNVGKSTLFNSLTQAGAEAANYPFCTIEPNVGIVSVPDKRLDFLTELYHPKKTIPAAFEFVDIAGLVAGASKGEGLGNQFLAHIREVDAIAHVVRCFDDENIAHVSGKIDPINDIEVINLELVLADLQSMEKKLDKLASKIKSKDKKSLAEFTLTERIIKEAFEYGKWAITLDFTDEEYMLLKTFNLLTTKKVIYVANLAEDEITTFANNPYYQKVATYASEHSASVIPVSAKIESEIAEFSAEEKQIFLLELNIPESGLDQLIHTAYRVLGLSTYFTAGEPEVRAWTIMKGAKAPQAAGVIHTDFERGFIRAEVVSFEDLVTYGSISQAKENGKFRLEGKDYIVQDGDILHFRFNV